MKHKKGQIENLQMLIVPLIAIGLVLAIGFLIVTEVKDKAIDTTSPPGTTIVNETVTLSNNTYVALAYGGNCMSFSCSEYYNETGGASSTLFDDGVNSITCDVNGLLMINASGNSLSSNAINITYTCTNMTTAYNASGDVQNAMQDIPGWLPIIVITMIGALLIGLVAVFRSRS